MQILFHLPQHTLSRCFADKDLARLQKDHDVILPPADADMNAGALEENFKKHAPHSRAIVTGWGTPPLTKNQLDLAPGLEVIVHSAGSIKHLVPEELWQRAIRVGTCNGALAVGVAENTLGMIIAGLKGYFPCRDWTRAGNWSDNKLGTNDFIVREPFDVTIGIIGASKVGRYLMKLLENFEVEILVYDPFFSEAEADELGVQSVSLEALMAQSDVVTLHAPVLDSTRHMLKAQHFQAMQDRAIFINTARGSIVDEAALIAEVQTGRIYAFIDVTDPEPPAADHPFRTLPNVILTPHIAGHASNGMKRQGRSTVDQLLEFAGGKAMSGEVTEAMFRVMA
jgi:phosphoglycerate dehydrogenase-like enzyme